MAQLEQLLDSSAWLSARATVPVGAINATANAPVGAINATANAVKGVQRLAELGLAEGDGDTLDDRWRATDAGYELVMATRGHDARRSSCSC